MWPGARLVNERLLDWFMRLRRSPHFLALTEKHKSCVLHMLHMQHAKANAIYERVCSYCLRRTVSLEKVHAPLSGLIALVRSFVSARSVGWLERIIRSVGIISAVRS